MKKDGEHYLIKGKVFETLDEARAFFEDYRKATGVFLGIERTRRKVTHRYRLGQERSQR